MKDNKVVLHDKRTKINPLWNVRPPPTPSNLTHPQPPINTAFVTQVVLKFTMTQRVMFFHVILGNSSLSAICNVIDNEFLTTWPETKLKLVHKYLPESSAMVKFYLNQTRRNQRMMHPILNPPPTYLPGKNPLPPQLPPGLPSRRAHFLYVIIFGRIKPT